MRRQDVTQAACGSDVWGRNACCPAPPLPRAAGGLGIWGKKWGFGAAKMAPETELRFIGFIGHCGLSRRGFPHRDTGVPTARVPVAPQGFAP